MTTKPHPFEGLRLDEITYLDKIKFLIPHHWVEEDDEEEGCYFDPAGDSGWLRVSLIRVDGAGTQDELRNDAREKGERLFEAGENLVRASVKSNIEQGEKISVHFWKVSRSVFPDLVRIAVFSYTVPESRTTHETWSAELKLIEDLVSKAEFIVPAS